MDYSNKKYSFALITGLYIALLVTAILAIVMYLEAKILYYIYLFVGFACVWLVSFLLIRFRTRIFILHQIEEVYDEVNMLESATFSKDNVVTDLEDLKRQVAQFTIDKRLEIEALQVREDYRKEFMGNISHELKTPLFTTQSYLLTLLDGAMQDESVRKKYLKRASKGLERLIVIVKDLDMISKLEVGDLNLHKEPFDIIEMLSSVFELFEMQAQRQDITLTFDIEYQEPIMVFADRERIQQVLTNLVVNSIKYGKSNGTTEVSVENLIQNKILVRITDNGEGIESENIPRLFERFYRVDKSGSRKQGGSGLGLAIVKHILEAHDEKIFVQSELEVGSEFSFTLEKAE